MLFRQLFDAASSTYTYLLADESTRDAVLIDPVFEQHARDAALIRELGLSLRMTLDTHCHADHVTGAWRMRAAFGSQIALSSAYGAEGVDVPLADGDAISFGHEILDARATPGHTVGCLAFVTRNRAMVFTGDALLIRGAGRTDFQGGDPGRLYRSIQTQILTLPAACAVYPGHDYQGRTSSTIAEESEFNPRIGGGAREEDFVGSMRNLGLPHPRQLAVAIPANMRCGRPDHDERPGAADWGPVLITYAGLPEIDAEWVFRHLADVHVVDVRSAAEFDGELGHIGGAQLVPLDELRARLQDIPRDKPIVTCCQTGRRSALASAILRDAGVKRVASLAGGLVQWVATER